jgi:hypothetical protein
VRRRLALTVLATASLALPAAACGGDQNPADSQGSSGAPQSSQAQQNPPSAPGAAGQATVDWANGFCAPIGGFTNEIQTKRPQLQGNSDPNATMAALAVFFDDLAKSAGGVVGDLEKLAPSPTPDGDRLKGSVLATFGPMRDSFASTATRLRGGDTVAAQQAIQDFSAKMQGLAEPFKNSPVSPELKQALQQAPTCKTLSAG